MHANAQVYEAQVSQSDGKPARCGMFSDAEIIGNVTFLSKHTPGTILSHYRKKPLLVVTYKHIEFQH